MTPYTDCTTLRLMSTLLAVLYFPLLLTLFLPAMRCWHHSVYSQTSSPAPPATLHSICHQPLHSHLFVLLNPFASSHMPTLSLTN